MGCIFCCGKSQDSEVQSSITTKPVEYSWNQRQKLDPKDYTIENCSNSCTGRLPGTINGEQFIIQNCKNMKIYLLDNIGAITVDDCSDCDLIIGPVKTSVFIRDCFKCNIMVACQQFRTRDCRNLNVFLSCTSQPIIESTSKFKVGSYQLYYPHLPAQFNSANLSPFNCTWSDIYDFTPVEESGRNYAFLPEETKPFDLICPPASVLNANMTLSHGDTNANDNEFVNKLMTMEITDSRLLSVVPYTLGNRRNIHSEGSGQTVSIIFFFHNNGEERKLANEFIKFILAKSKAINLIKTRETKLTSENARLLFSQTTVQKDVVIQGPMISLEYFGSVTIDTLVSAFMTSRLSTEDLSHLLYASPDIETSKAQIDLLNNLTNMSMNPS